MKDCKSSTHTHIHLFLTDFTGFFYMPEDLLIILDDALFHAFAELKQYQKLEENYNSSFKMNCGLLPGLLSFFLKAAK